MDFGASLDFGRTFSITISYVPSEFRFEFAVNGEATEPLEIPDSTPDIVFDYVQVEGDLEVTFLGFIEPHQSPSVPIGTALTYKCPKDHVFAHDWLHKPEVRLKCLDDGLFVPPDIWPTCIYRELWTMYKI